jgi:predicted TIM-barrel fold metal-dependent hydrolase
MEKGIVDIHCHTAGIGAGGSGCFVSPALRRSWRYRFFLAAFGVTQQELERCGDSLVMQRLSERLAESRFVSAAVVLAMDGIIGEDGRIDRQRTELYIPNDYLARECRKYDNLLFGASINPLRGDALERLDRAVEEGAALVKWLPSIQLINPADSRITPFYNRLRELGLPLLTHTGYEESFTWARNELADPELLRLPLELGVTVIAAHAASNGRAFGERNFDRFLRLCDRFPNLYADVSALTQVNRLGQLPRLLRQRKLLGRLLYGTDMPIIKTGVTSPWFHSYRLSPGTVRRIAAITNPWDRDVELKLALGMPEEIFANSVGLFGVRFKSSG